VNIIIIIIIIIIYHIYTSTTFGLNNPGFEPRWGQDIFIYPRPLEPVPRTTLPTIQGVMGVFPRGKALGCDVDHPHPSNDKVKKRVEPYSYSHTWLPGLL